MESPPCSFALPLIFLRFVSHKTSTPTSAPTPAHRRTTVVERQVRVLKPGDRVRGGWRTVSDIDHTERPVERIRCKGGIAARMNSFTQRPPPPPPPANGSGPSLRRAPDRDLRHPPAGEGASESLADPLHVRGSDENLHGMVRPECWLGMVGSDLRA